MAPSDIPGSRLGLGGGAYFFILFHHLSPHFLKEIAKPSLTASELFQVENQSDDDGQDEDWSLMGAELERELGS
jgi:hypothetical protein